MSLSVRGRGLIRGLLLAALVLGLAGVLFLPRAVGARALARVVGGVEPGALEVDRDRAEDTLDRRLAHLAEADRIVRHALEGLEGVAVSAPVFVDGHREEYGNRHGGRCRCRCS